MTKNERKIIFNMVRMQGVLAQALGRVALTMDDKDEQRNVIDRLDEAVGFMNAAVELMDEEWSNEKH
jgi:hypothetical protein